MFPQLTLSIKMADREDSDILSTVVPDQKKNRSIDR